MKRTIVLSLLLLVLITAAFPTFAVTFLWQDSKGAHVYGCNKFCGKVRVKKTARGEYRVYSITFSGDMKASSEKQAAMKACRELAMGESAKSAETATRNGTACY